MPGSVTTPMPTASVRFTIGGTVYTAAVPTAVPADRWLDGGLVRETRSIVAPVTAANAAHPLLRVFFDVRAYVDGAVRLDVTVENTFDITGGRQVTYDVAVVAGGSTLFTELAVTHHYLCRWRKVFDLGAASAHVTPDLAPAIAAGALPRYLSTVTDGRYTITGPTYRILGRGANTYDGMGAVGGRPEIAPYPDWAAEYLVHRAPDQQALVLANGDLFGSWPIHIRETDGSLISIDDRPGFWLDPRGQDVYTPPADRPKGDLSDPSLGPLQPDIAHVPSMAYIPYLMTGDRYLIDELALWTNWFFLQAWSTDIAGGGRGGDQGILINQQIRGQAWGLRNTVDCCAYLPDNYPQRAYLISKLMNNLNYYRDYAASHVAPLNTSLEITGNIVPSDRLHAGDAIIQVSVWQGNYLAWTLDHAAAQGFSAGPGMRDRLAAFQLKLFTSTADGYDRLYAAPYYPVVGTIDSAGTWHLFATIAQVFDYNYRLADGSLRPVDYPTPNPDEGGPGPEGFAGYYGIDARLSLKLGVRLGWAGAQDALDYLVPQLGDDLTTKSGWAIA